MNYTKNYADRLKKALTNIEEQNINAEEKPERANYLKNIEYAPEGWYTIAGLEKELEISTKAISARLPDVAGKEYRDSGGKPRIHYNLEEIKNLPEIQKLRDMKIAPEGWYTILGLAKELGISFETISANLSDIAGKEYRDSGGKPRIHYNLEEIKNLPEIQKAIEKSKMRKRAQKTIDSSM